MKFVLIELKNCKLTAEVNTSVLSDRACWIRTVLQEMSATKLVADCTAFQHHHPPIFPCGYAFLTITLM